MFAASAVAHDVVEFMRIRLLLEASFRIQRVELDSDRVLRYEEDIAPLTKGTQSLR